MATARERLQALIFCIAAVVIIAAPAHAGSGLALIVGNGAYSDPRAGLANPPNDAATMAAKLRSRGFDVTVLSDATAFEMREAVRVWSARAHQAGGDEAHFFYYSGHGVQFDGQNYLVPVDVDTRDRESVRTTSLPLTWLLQQISSFPSRVNYVVLDACRNDPFSNQALGDQPGLSSIDPVGNALVAFSTAEGRVANDGDGRNSRFTAALALQDEYASAPEVFERAREYTIDHSGGTQRPEYIALLDGKSREDWRLGAVGGAGITWEGVEIGNGRPTFSFMLQRDPVFDSSPAIADRSVPAAVFDRFDDVAAELSEVSGAPVSAELSELLAAGLAYALDTGADDASIKPDYMHETYPDIIEAVASAAAPYDWSGYDLALFLVHAAYDTYQFQAYAEFGSSDYFDRYDHRPDLGNTEAGDGERFRGRGLLHIRGKTRYRRLSAHPRISTDLIGDPDLLGRDHALATLASVILFEGFRQEVSGDLGSDVIATTRLLTGSLDDVGRREEYFIRMFEELSRRDLDIMGAN